MLGQHRHAVPPRRRLRRQPGRRAEALNAGVTTLLDWSHVNNTPDHSDEAIRGLTESGIRAVYAHGVPVGAQQWWSYSPHNHPEDIRRLRTRDLSSEDWLLTLALAARAPGNTTPDVARHDWAARAGHRRADQRPRRHAADRCARQSRAESPPARADGTGTIYIHRTDSTDEELDSHCRRPAYLTSLAPYVEMLMGHGVPPTGRLLARGVRPSPERRRRLELPGDMFTQMRTALAQERILSFTNTPTSPSRRR